MCCVLFVLVCCVVCCFLSSGVDVVAEGFVLSVFEACWEDVSVAFEFRMCGPKSCFFKGYFLAD